MSGPLITGCFPASLSQKAGTIGRFPRDLIGLENSWRSAVHGRETEFHPEGVMANVYLGATVAGLYILVGLGIIIAFM